MNIYNKEYTTIQANKDIFIANKVSLDECKIITQRIKEENKIHTPHMIEITAEELLEVANTQGCCAIKNNEELVGFIKVLSVEENEFLLLERWSVIVKEEYRNQWWARYLVKTVLETHKTTPMYSVTNVEAIQKITQLFWQQKYLASEIPKQILEIMEKPGKLLQNDTIYANEVLHILIQKLW